MKTSAVTAEPIQQGRKSTTVNSCGDEACFHAVTFIMEEKTQKSSGAARSLMGFVEDCLSGCLVTLKALALLQKADTWAVYGKNP